MLLRQATRRAGWFSSASNSLSIELLVWYFSAMDTRLTKERIVTLGGKLDLLRGHL